MKTEIMYETFGYGYDMNKKFPYNTWEDVYSGFILFTDEQLKQIEAKISTDLKQLSA